MNIQVRVQPGTGEPALYSEGYASHIVDIVIDKDLPLRYQEEVVIHEVVECYCPFLSHDKVVELTGYILEGLRQLSNADES